jgi:hypothetical protein
VALKAYMVLCSGTWAPLPEYKFFFLLRNLKTWSDLVCVLINNLVWSMVLHHQQRKGKEAPTATETYLAALFQTQK